MLLICNRETCMDHGWRVVPVFQKHVRMGCGPYLVCAVGAGLADLSPSSVSLAYYKPIYEMP